MRSVFVTGSKDSYKSHVDNDWNLQLADGVKTVVKGLGGSVELIFYSSVYPGV